MLNQLLEPLPRCDRGRLQSTHTTTHMKTRRTWTNQFGASYEVPAAILAATIDESWHNDMCPCFLRKNDPMTDGEPAARLWVEHPDAAMREVILFRFMVCDRFADLMATNDADEALAFFLSLELEPLAETPERKMARAFSAALKICLTADEMTEVRRLNQLPEYPCPAICASHNFCDANEVMDEAFTAIMGHEIDTRSHEQRMMWNNAWIIARQSGFTI